MVVVIVVVVHDATTRRACLYLWRGGGSWDDRGRGEGRRRLKGGVQIRAPLGDFLLQVC